MEMLNKNEMLNYIMVQQSVLNQTKHKNLYMKFQLNKWNII